MGEQDEHLVERDTLERLFGIVHRLVIKSNVVAAPSCHFAGVDAIDELSKLVDIDAPEGEGITVAKVVMESGRAVLVKRVAVRRCLEARDRPSVAVDLDLEDAM